MRGSRSKRGGMAGASGLDPLRRDGSVTLADGRRLAYRRYGVTDGEPVLALHGTPGSRLKFSAADEAAHRLGLAIVAPDRWGYGATCGHPLPSLASFADDLEALADSLGMGRFALLGVSGGGPYATAVAARLGVRVTALALVAPVGPIAGEADAEITAFHRMCFGPLARRPRAVAGVFAAFRALLGTSPELAMRLTMLHAAPADRQVLASPSTRRRLGDTFIEGLRPGLSGPVTDMSLFGARWDVEPGHVRAPARLWLGTDDRNVPRSAARRLAARIPGCELTELAGDGHMWIADNYPAVLAWIGDMLAGRQAGDQIR